MLNKFKLKHLDAISDKPDYKTLMVEIFGFKNSFLNRVFRLKKTALKTHDLINKIAKLEFKKFGVPPKSPILYPKNVGSVPFLAITTLQLLKGKGLSKAVFIAEYIATVCYTSFTKKDFDNESFEYKILRDKILNEPVVDMIGLFYHLDREMFLLSQVWEKRFLEVDVEDADYMQAGGAALKNFNVVNTVSKICKDFNLSYSQAWQVPFDVVQTKSLADATSAFVQSNMAKIKEEKMRQKRRV